MGRKTIKENASSFKRSSPGWKTFIVNKFGKQFDSFVSLNFEQNPEFNKELPRLIKEIYK